MDVLKKILSYLPDWDVWVGAFIAFIVPFSISRIVKWLNR